MHAHAVFRVCFRVQILQDIHILKFQTCFFSRQFIINIMWQSVCTWNHINMGYQHQLMVQSAFSILHRRTFSRSVYLHIYVYLLDCPRRVVQKTYKLQIFICFWTLTNCACLFGQCKSLPKALALWTRTGSNDHLAN